ncbi:UDP-glucuronosyl/UDP-glucosyltransferase [Artemisia annua]|uniref:UDP-glucuronosyl/UDP-glucosyltransferase n=1 Tax=Artemisia annua TaxID=35608 RepID=A0A2U1MKP6_ARTAN|nr:UDP-glucuronosyl/UDP-glucosyltransferase [Artemisia annua]
MGHLTPALRLAAMLSSKNCQVTLITPQPPVSTAESSHIAAFLAAYPTVNRLDFQIVPYTPPEPTDPFAVQFEAVIRSVHLLTPLLASVSPPLSAFFSDITTAAGGHQVAEDLGLPHYVVSLSARFSSFVASITVWKYDGNHGLASFDISTIPSPFFLPNHLFTKTLVSNARALSKAKGILLNTFHAFEPETITSVNDGKFIPDFPPLLPIGPFEPHKLEIGDHKPLPWLDQQPPKSVVYVSFGSRTAMSRDQIRELGKGLEESGFKFLWVLKAKIVDKDDNEGPEEIVGDSFIGRTKHNGLVIKGWVNQEEILSHPAVGGFVSHVGWNSVMETAVRGMPMLAWPLLGDQKVYAGLVEAVGLGVWEKSWGWLGERLVKGEEIAKMVKKVMCDESLRESATIIGEEGMNAIKVGGSSYKVLMGTIQNLSI